MLDFWLYLCSLVFKIHYPEDAKIGNKCWGGFACVLLFFFVCFFLITYMRNVQHNEYLCSPI